MTPDQLRGDTPSKKLASYNVILEHEPGPDFVAIERVNLRVSAGVTGFSVEHFEENGPPIFFRADWLAQSGYKSTHLFALKVVGDSMEPGLWEGDLIVMNQADTTPRDESVFVVNFEGEIVIKRLLRNNGQWWLSSDNPRYRPKLCDENSLLVGRVVYKQSNHI
jgi:phage repressor protein C with HTH and peptisase S24 domain